jgi:hypothetical protein
MANSDTLLAGVHQRAHQRARRRRVAVALTAAACTAAVVTVAATTAGGRTSSPPPAGPAITSLTTQTSPTRAAPSATTTPSPTGLAYATRLPYGMQLRDESNADLGTAGHTLTLFYAQYTKEEAGKAGATGLGKTLVVTTVFGSRSSRRPAEDANTTVRGRPAWTTTDDSQLQERSLSWYESNDVEVQLYAAQLSVAQLRDIAENITFGPTTVVMDTKTGAILSVRGTTSSAEAG